jgi:hypothetical protein
MRVVYGEKILRMIIKSLHVSAIHQGSIPASQFMVQLFFMQYFCANCVCIYYKYEKLLNAYE